MTCYEQMYYKLFNKITDVIDELQEIQQITEEMFIFYSSEHEGGNDSNAKDG